MPVKDLKDEIARVITPFLTCDEFYARLEAVKALGDLGSGHSAAPLSSIALDANEEIDMRMDAIESLAKIGHPESHDVFNRLLQDQLADIRLLAICALGSMEVPSATEQIIDLLQASNTDMLSDDEFDWDPQWDIQLEAVRALGKAGDDKAVAPITRLYEDEMSYDLSEDVFSALCRIASPEAIRYLSGKLKTGIEQERRLIVQAIAKNEKILLEMKGELTQALGDNEPSVRAAAITAYALGGGEEVLTTLNYSLTDPDATVRASALVAVTKINAGESIQQIVIALKDRSHNVRAQAAVAAQKCPLDMVCNNLLDLMGDKEDEVALNAARSLVSFKTFEETPTLLARVALDNSRTPYMRIECINLMAAHHLDLVPQLLPSPLDIRPRQVSIAVASCLVRCGTGEEIDYLINDLRELAGIGAEPDNPGEVDGRIKEQGEIEASVKIGKKTRMVVRSPGATPGTLNAEDLIRVLSVGTHPKIKAILGECLTLKKSTIAAAAARAIGDMGGADYESALITALDHPSPHVRSEAAQALGVLKTGDKIVTSKLGELATTDAEKMVREKSISALGHIRIVEGQTYLQKGLEDQQLSVRHLAVIALGNCDDNRAITPLIAKLFNYEDFTHLRPDMYLALRKLDLAMVKKGLNEVLSDEKRPFDHWVAIQAMGKIFG